MLWSSPGARFRRCFPTGRLGRDARVCVLPTAAVASFTVAALLPTMVAMADNLLLVTQEEFLAELQAGIEAPPLTRAFSVPGAPKIDVLQPEISGRKPITNPIAIELQFFSAPDADIDPGSFRAYYGFLRIDLTKRILKHVHVGKSGLKVDNAEIPSGKHHLFLRIADSKERTTERELRFVVE